MCGFTGLLNVSSLKNDDLLMNEVLKMSQALQHRGPDDYGNWVDSSVGIALGHRRLSIIELSQAGHQPMVSKSGRFVIAFNGEIYNHQEIRKLIDLAKHSNFNFSFDNEWKGNSDTETLLSAIELWGLEVTLTKTVGMFAFAVWDIERKVLHLIRDRFGEKPIYYGWIGPINNQTFVFGSELKAIKAHSEFNNSVCRNSLTQYMRLGYVPSPLSIYERIYKLEPGSILTLTPSDVRLFTPSNKDGNIVKIDKWWSTEDIANAGALAPVISEIDALDKLEEQLFEAVRSQSLADVPLGAFLSGGVDSSLITALMQHQSNKPVKTFTIGFEETGFDESLHARSVSQYLGTEHYELRVSPQMAQDLIPKLSMIYDEPFADSSQIPTHLVSKLARNYVTVALSGDGGDELFGGYNRYFWGPTIWKSISWMPYQIRQVMGSAMLSVPANGWSTIASFVQGTQGVVQIGDKVRKLGESLKQVRNLDEMYESLVTKWHDPASLVIQNKSEVLFINDSRVVKDSLNLDFSSSLGPAEKMMLKDSLTYLPDDILCKVDRAAMACSLETRVPFLDHRVAELAWKLPIDLKIKGNTGKWALRQVLYKYVPQKLIDRPKSGFAIPIGNWLKGPLKDWAEDLLSEERLRSEGYFNSQPIRIAWAEHLANIRDNSDKLWTVLMFQAWLKEQG
jgi:asparagine synthase (glutamine-hydrolysing)